MKALFLILFSASLWAYPQKTTIYFYTTDLSAATDIDQVSKLIAKNSLKLKCQKHGEYCFDPQVGLYDPKDQDAAIAIKNENTESPNQLNKVKGLGSEGFFNQSLINCDKNKFYDVFCSGSDSKKSKKDRVEKFEIWMDTSNIMKTKDNIPLEKNCYRSNFLNLLQDQCTQNNTFRLFAISSIKKRLGSNFQACQNGEKNLDLEQLKTWLKRSRAQRLFVFLDEYYATGMFLSFLKTKSNIEVKGLEEKVQLNKMDKQIKDLKRYCN